MRVLALNGVYQAKAQRGFVDVYIRPPVEKYNILDFGAYQQIAEIGYRSAMAELKASVPGGIMPAPGSSATGSLRQALAELEAAVAGMGRAG